MPDKRPLAILRQKVHKYYKTVGSLWCPAIKDNVVFNKHGWTHINFERGGKRRYTPSIRLRLHLFMYVPEAVKSSKILVKKSCGQIKSKRGIVRDVEYFEIAHLCDKETRLITVILRKIGDKGNLHYYSVRRTTLKTKKALQKSGLI